MWTPAKLAHLARMQNLEEHAAALQNARDERVGGTREQREWRTDPKDRDSSKRIAALVATQII